MKRREFNASITCACAMAMFQGCAPVAETTKVKDAIREDEIELLSFCGLDCTACDVYQYTITGKVADFEKMYASWNETAKKHWGMTSLDPKQLHCKGCRYEGEDKFHSPSLCPIRACAKRKRLNSCGLCRDVDKCNPIRGLFNDCPEAKVHIDKIKTLRKQEKL